MNSTLRLTTPLQNVFWHTGSSTLKQLFIMLLGVCILALAAQLSIPLRPVPLTFQSATVVLIGMTFGAKRGASVVAAYLLAGIAGLPVYSNLSAGLNCLMSHPSSGYLIGFLPAAYVSGFLAERGLGKSILGCLITAFVGAFIIFGFGLPVLALYVGWQQAFIYGLLPFIISEPIKLLAAACVAPSCWK